ncbi:MAG: hypothetical protein ACE5EC_04780 [Phycisphaerae bacterium]
MIRVGWMLYGVVAVGMMVTSLLTGRRASAVAGSPHYLFTRTQVFVEERVAAEDATQSALDALFEEAGEPAMRTVARPMLVLGLLDATGPIVLVGGVGLGIATLVGRRRRVAGHGGGDELP